MTTTNKSQASTSHGFHLATVEDLSESCLTSLNSFEEDSAYGSSGKNSSAGYWKPKTSDKNSFTPAARALTAETAEKIDRFDYGQLSLRSLRNKEPS